MNRWLLFLLVPTLLGAAPVDPVPTAPFVKPIPLGTTWSVDVSVASEKEDVKVRAAPPGALKPPQDSPPNRLVMQAGRDGVAQGTIFYPGEKRDEFFVFKDAVMQKATNSEKISITSARTSEQDYISLRVASFPCLSWLSLRNYTGIQTKDGVKCFHFFEVIMFGDPPKPSDKLEAWIRIEDRQPIEASAGEWKFRYSEVTPFDGSIELPQNFRQALAGLQKKQAALEAIRRKNAKLD